MITETQSKIDYWSPSSFNAFLTNRAAFKDTYINKIYDNTTSVTGVIGKAGHKALEAYYNGKEIHEAIAVGMEYIAGLSDYEINYGKTGNRANMLATYNKSINFYFAEMPTYHEVIGPEIKITTEVQTIYGEKLPLPMKGTMDLLVRNKLGQIEIIDHKFVYNYSDGSLTSPARFLQAMFYFHIVWAKFGEKPVRMVFNECKTSKNSNGENQIQPYTIDYEEMQSYFPAFYKLYDLTTIEVNETKTFLPNFNDTFNGQAAFDKFVAGVMDLEAPVAVKHKTEQLTYQDKQFIPSAFDKVENKNLAPEQRIMAKLQEFGIPVQHTDTKVGPSVTKYFFTPSAGVSMKKVSGLSDDMKLAIEAESIRVEAPVAGTGLIGIEVPSVERTRVDLAESHLKAGTMNIPIGVNINGKVIHQDLTKAPHMLIAGTTGSGKSVMLNVLIDSLAKQMDPEDLKMILIDPKQVELSFFDDLPHLYTPIITDHVVAADYLDRMVKEMETRYALLKEAKCRTIADYHAKGKKMPYIVIVIDEFADLMMMSDSKSETFAINGKDLAKSIVRFSQQHYDINQIDLDPTKEVPKEVQKEHKDVLKDLTGMIMAAAETGAAPAETSIVRIAQKARAVGIHLVLATQRPSADVVTGLIKANIPTKIAFMVSTRVNSQVILDQPGAEELIGMGDMLFQDPTKNTLQRLQGLYL